MNNVRSKLTILEQSRWAMRWWKPHDPTVVSFESIPACNRGTDWRIPCL